MTHTEGSLNKGQFSQDVSNGYSRYSHSASSDLFCGILFSILLIYKSSMRSFMFPTLK